MKSKFCEADDESEYRNALASPSYNDSSEQLDSSREYQPEYRYAPVSPIFCHSSDEEASSSDLVPLNKTIDLE